MIAKWYGHNKMNVWNDDMPEVIEEIYKANNLSIIRLSLLSRDCFIEKYDFTSYPSFLSGSLMHSHPALHQSTRCAQPLVA